jgi:hypothetical protein
LHSSDDINQDKSKIAISCDGLEATVMNSHCSEGRVLKY